jgi:hypothetical protein
MGKLLSLFTCFERVVKSGPLHHAIAPQIIFGLHERNVKVLMRLLEDLLE